MARAGSRARPAAGTVVPADRALIELDLVGWAGMRGARSGRRDALLGRVEALSLGQDGRSLEARVRGSRPLPYHVSLAARDGRVESRCTCSSQAVHACRHAVAALESLRFPARAAASAHRGSGRGRIVRPAWSVGGTVVIGAAERVRPREERIAEAAGEERAARRHEARRTPARIEPVRDRAHGAPRWRVLTRHGSAVETVTLRGQEGEGLACTCRDFAESELGTCWHVERVRRHRARQRRSDRRVPPQDLLSVWLRPRVWLEEPPEPIREVRFDGPAALVRPRALSRYFDDEHWLRLPPAGRRRSAWIGAACTAARGVARRAGWKFELDPAVDSLARSALGEGRRLERSIAAATDREEWSRMSGRVRLSLHPYQEEGVRFLARAGRAFLADDMGLGKTVQAIAAAMLLAARAGVRRTLVICPASLKHQWLHEIRDTCGQEATLVEGPRASRHAAYARWSRGFLVVNYELLLRDLASLSALGPELVILDEAQRIKNWETATARAVKLLTSPYAFVLSGTPLENRLGELHSLVEFLHRRAAGPRWRLLPFHAVRDAPGRIVAYEGLDVLRARLAGFFLRRERRTVQDQLPPRTENTFWTGMSAAQLRPYRAHAAAAAAVLARRAPLGPQDTRALLAALTAMRILCNAHAQYAWRDAAESADQTPRSPKLEEFARVLEEVLEGSDSKIVVFSEWERMLRLAHAAARGLLSRLDQRGEVFHGGLSGHKRVALLREFQEDPDFRVLFSTDAGGVGLNLQVASVVVNLDVPWNPAVLEQRIARVHRMGQRRAVQVLHFVARGTIEERVREVLQEKRALFEGLLGGDDDRVDLGRIPGGAGWIDSARLLLAPGGA